MLADMEDNGIQALNTLTSQKETIKKSLDKMQQLNNDLQKTNSLIRKMERWF